VNVEFVLHSAVMGAVTVSGRDDEMASRVSYDNDAVHDDAMRPGDREIWDSSLSFRTWIPEAEGRESQDLNSSEGWNTSESFDGAEGWKGSESFHGAEGWNGSGSWNGPEDWSGHAALERNAQRGRGDVWQRIVWVGILLFGLSAGAGLGMGLSQIRTTVAPSTKAAGASADTGFKAVSNDIVVDVKGDVRKPGLVRVAANARVKDVIEAAGGLLHEEDSMAVNLAAPVDDGQELVVPDVLTGQSAGSNSGVEVSRTVNAAAPGAGMANANGNVANNGSEPNMKVDLNTANAETLQTIPGIGPSKADAILRFRQQHGRFESVNELQKVGGIGPVTYQRIAPYVVVLVASTQSGRH
jgi:competence protein ComEA